jgi:hypothetical protein
LHWQSSAHAWTDAPHCTCRHVEHAPAPIPASKYAVTVASTIAQEAASAAPAPHDAAHPAKHVPTCTSALSDAPVRSDTHEATEATDETPSMQRRALTALVLQLQSVLHVSMLAEHALRMHDWHAAGPASSDRYDVTLASADVQPASGPGPLLDELQAPTPTMTARTTASATKREWRMLSGTPLPHVCGVR